MRRERKIISSSSILFLFLVFFINMVSALPFSGSFSDPIATIQSFEQSAAPILSILLGVDSVDENLFARFLFFLIVFTITVLVLSRMELFKEKKPIITIIALSVSLLGTRYLGGLDIITGLLLPYGTLMIAISVALPFIIYFFFIHNTINSGIGRRIGWVLFGSIFLGLWWTRRTEMGDLSWIYNLGIAAVVIVILADSEIHKYFGIHDMQNARRAQINMEITELETKLANFRNNNPTPSKIAQETITKLERRINELYRKI